MRSENLEERIMKVSAVEYRAKEKAEADSEEPKMTIGGYAVRFDEPQTYQWGDTTYTETIKKGALDSADMKRVPLRYNHNDSVLVMARTKNDSLRLTIDDEGLYIEADLIDTQTNRDLYKCIADGLLDEMSFAFTVAPDGDKWEYSDDYKTVTRDITAIDCLYDVSVVDNGFYETTSVFTRALGRLDECRKEAEQHLLELERARALARAKM